MRRDAPWTSANSSHDQRWTIDAIVSRLAARQSGHAARDRLVDGKVAGGGDRAEPTEGYVLLVLCDASHVSYGRERWKAWYGSLYPLLIRTQKKEGEYAGSWEPNGRIPDAWGRFGGRLYVTTLNLLSLEVYYRHLPIYEATAD